MISEGETGSASAAREEKRREREKEKRREEKEKWKEREASEERRRERNNSHLVQQSVLCVVFDCEFFLSFSLFQTHTSVSHSLTHERKNQQNVSPGPSLVCIRCKGLKGLSSIRGRSNRLISYRIKRKVRREYAPVHPLTVANALTEAEQLNISSKRHQVIPEAQKSTTLPPDITSESPDCT